MFCELTNYSKITLSPKIVLVYLKVVFELGSRFVLLQFV